MYRLGLNGDLLEEGKLDLSELLIKPMPILIPYDIMHEEKSYPSKLLVSWANVFANNQELDRLRFDVIEILPASGY